MLQAQVKSDTFSDVQAQPNYQALPIDVQSAIALDYFAKRVETQESYKKAPPEAQAAMREDFINKYQIPMPDRQPITAGQPLAHKVRPMVGIPAGIPGMGVTPLEVSSPQVAQNIQNKTGKAASLFLNDYTKGATFGYLDPNKLAGDPLQRQALMQDPVMRNAAMAGDIGGSLIPIEGAASLANAGLKQLESAGSRLALNPNVPKYLQGAATKAVPFLRGVESGLQKIGPVWRDALEQTAAFGGYEGLKAREGQDQFDPMGRLQSAALGAGVGALFPILGAAGKNIVTGARDIFRPQAMPTGLGNVLQGSVQKTVTEPAVKLLEGLERDFASLMDDIHANDLAEYVSEGAINRLSTIKDRITRSAAGVLNMSLGEVRSHRSTLTKIRRELKASAQKSGRDLKPARLKEAESVAKETAKPTEPTPAELQGQIEETAKRSGMTLDELLTAKPKDLTPEQKQIQANIKAVQSSEVVDAQAGTLKQKPLDAKALTYDAVKDAVQNKAVGDKLEAAAKAGESVRLEYVAEETGRTGKAAVITKSGNAKVATSTFTPTHFTLTKDGKPMVGGYNENGIFRSYHINESTNGSVIQKVGKQIPEAFRGEYPNIYQGVREFKAADVLNRGGVSEGVLTSEALTMANAAKDLFESNAFKQLSPQVQKLLRNTNKRGRFEPSELRYILDKIKKDKKELEAVCNILGLI